jgi:hypothetical protein
MEENNQITIYQTADQAVQIEVRVGEESVWLTQAQMTTLFERERSVITKHIRNVFEEGELLKDQVCANFAHTAADAEEATVANFATVQVVVNLINIRN